MLGGPRPTVTQYDFDITAVLFEEFAPFNLVERAQITKASIHYSRLKLCSRHDFGNHRPLEPKFVYEDHNPDGKQGASKHVGDSANENLGVAGLLPAADSDVQEPK